MWKRALNLLYIPFGALDIGIDAVRAAPYCLTLTELHIDSLRQRALPHICALRNLRILSVEVVFRTVCNELIYLKSLSNLKELYLSFEDEGYEPVDDAGLIEPLELVIASVFRRPKVYPEMYFPYSLKCLTFSYLAFCKDATLRTIAQGYVHFYAFFAV
ncbi:unnamed protein product [Gongylonema pulchrum]|uniref:FBD domain-containing protein n=1 Tax=Gongylonema pulchrum TaxID=637853 RepID=A0A183EE16_9BILA|nr:unnamed protein product [Gongylonema pulchrum]